ncbi:MAG: 4-hydroxy-3-methylbut-2-enyl diphosphate reductase [Bacteroidetes bacterium]|nr:4-hydroxy-3-methylbut-2-enyl diphosphate reductase [Bacteroidota bacterium]
MNVKIDENSGFCFGVVYAIQMAEDELDTNGSLYCLGDIVHNNMEVERLSAKGLKIIDHEELKQLHDTKVLIRAHGEPPETYKIAIDNNIQLIDASCPVVLKLQNRIRNGYEEKGEGQIVVYGKNGHAEVNGLVGQTRGEAIIANSIEDLDQIDFSKPVKFFSQTTQPTEGYKGMRDEIIRRMREAGNDENLFFEANDTLCRQVSNREPQLKVFANEYDVIVFVSGKKSSNGKVLYDVCKSVNPNSYFISEWSEFNPEWLKGFNSVGICGATSTPMWLMEEVAENIRSLDPIEV